MAMSGAVSAAPAAADSTSIAKALTRENKVLSACSIAD
jgi:hypothetical protein